MTDAREIIATKLPTAYRDEWAQEIINTLTAAGYRILGPDEVQALDRTLRNALEARLPPVVAQDVAAAIRNLGEKA